MKILGLIVLSSMLSFSLYSMEKPPRLVFLDLVKEGNVQEIRERWTQWSDAKYEDDEYGPIDCAILAAAQAYQKNDFHKLSDFIELINLLLENRASYTDDDLEALEIFTQALKLEQEKQKAYQALLVAKKSKPSATSTATTREPAHKVERSAGTANLFS